MKTITLGLMNIACQYEGYFKDENADVDRDKLFMMHFVMDIQNAYLAEDTVRNL